MWVLPKNYQLSSAFAADMVESKEDLILQGLNIEQSLMWRSKPSPYKTWCRRWKEDSFLPHLFTRILKPSQRTSFETKLTSSLADIHASPFQQQESDLVKMTQDICGHTSESTWKQLDLIELCLKTSKDTYRLDSPQSLATWKKMVLIQRGEYSARVKLAHTTKGSEYLSWATPNTLDYLPTRSFESVVKQTTTTRKGRKRPSNLREQVDQKTVDIYKYQSWPTVRVSSSHGASQNEIDKGNPKKRLETEVIVRKWATPRVADSAGGPRTLNEKGQRISVSDPTKTYGANLSDQVRHWPTPMASDWKNMDTCNQMQLAKAVKVNYPTPRASEYKDCGPVGSKSHTHMDAKRYLCAKVKNANKPKEHLNPDWVEKLMGVPKGWTALDGDSNEWQNNWSGDWEGNTPRTTDVKKDRVDRIRMLGNGVVPATAAKAWTVLSARLNKGE